VTEVSAIFFSLRQFFPHIFAVIAVEAVAFNKLSLGAYPFEDVFQ